MFEKPTILSFSIIVTNRCNANCTYCHFYGLDKSIKKDKLFLDIDDETYDLYLLFLKDLKKYFKSSKNLLFQFRFSGGDPLVLGTRLFDLVDRGYKTIGIKPYILTNGLAINDRWIKEAKKHKIKNLLVSIENPIDSDPGAPNPDLIIDKIKRFNSKELPIIPGVCIVRNKDFKNLYNICKYFYDKLGVIPVISELNFQSFEIPSEQEYQDLYKNIKKIVKEFYNKTQLVLFPYISPEISYSGLEQYLLELDIYNRKYSLNKNDSVDRKLNLVYNQIEKSYPKVGCSNESCDWFEFCQNYKWVWTKTFNDISLEDKKKSYCRLKKVINQAFYEA
ncbi:radical SAM protein [Candidatus Parcubacteria bacterium]|nr:MAG: radical SAM protein [Candidatus Parcubacteria bacterium]